MHLVPRPAFFTSTPAKETTMRTFHLIAALVLAAGTATAAQA